MHQPLITIPIATDRDRYVNRYRDADTPAARNARILRIALLVRAAALTEGARRRELAASTSAQ
jgi:hypothetical protein